jgi:hypothetical protein
MACDPRTAARFRGGRVSELSSPKGSPLFLAKGHTDSAFRVAPRGISPFVPVDNVDNVDKWAAWPPSRRKERRNPVSPPPVAQEKSGSEQSVDGWIGRLQLIVLG